MSDADCTPGREPRSVAASHLSYPRHCDGIQPEPQQAAAVSRVHIWTDLTVHWIGFYLTGPVSLCLDSYCTYVFRVLQVVVLEHGEVDLVGLKPDP